MVPIFAAVGQRLTRKLPAGAIAALGCVLCASGAWMVLSSVRAQPDVLGAVLPGWMISSAGVGLAMPTMLSCATVDLLGRALRRAARSSPWRARSVVCSA